MFDSTKLNTFQGKTRFYETYSIGIERIWVWDKKKLRYVKPKRGGHYRVRKRIEGKTKSVCFLSLRDAEKFRRGEIMLDSTIYFGPTLNEVFNDFRKSYAWDYLMRSTQNTYELGWDRFWFDFLRDIPIRKISPAKLDDWISYMGENISHYGNQKKTFKKELDLLKSVVTYYQHYQDDTNFVSPFKERHEMAVFAWAKNEEKEEHEFSDEIPLDEKEFAIFLYHLRLGCHGKKMGLMATIQYAHALRSCESSVIKGTDFLWNKKLVTFKRHRLFLRGKGKADETVPGLKNRKSRAFKDRSRKYSKPPIKVHPIFPHYLTELAEYWLAMPDKSKDIFTVDGELFTYKQIQYAFNKAFERAGLPYRGTHIVRKAGNTVVFDHTQCRETSKELLGNDVNIDEYILVRSKKLEAIADILWQGDQAAQARLRMLKAAT